MPWIFYLLDNGTIHQPKCIENACEKYLTWERDEERDPQGPGSIPRIELYADDVCLFTPEQPEVRWVAELAQALQDTGDTTPWPRARPQRWSPDPDQRLAAVLAEALNGNNAYVWQGTAANKERYEAVFKSWARRLSGDVGRTGQLGVRVPYNVLARSVARIAIAQWFESYLTK